MTPDTNPDPVKALLEACEPDEMRALKAFIENAPCACHPQVQCIRCTALENYNALSRAASVDIHGPATDHMRDTLIGLMVAGVFSEGQTARATGLDRVEVRRRAAERVEELRSELLQENPHG